MVKVRLLLVLCCVVVLTSCSNFFKFHEPAMTTTKLPLVGRLKFFFIEYLGFIRILATSLYAKCLDVKQVDGALWLPHCSTLALAKKKKATQLTIFTVTPHYKSSQ